MVRLPKESLTNLKQHSFFASLRRFLKKLHFPAKFVFWFSTGIILGLFLVVGIFYLFFREFYADKVYPGVTIGAVNVGGKTKADVAKYFDMKNAVIKKSTFTFKTDSDIATISAQKLQIAYNSNLLAEQAYTVGRSPDTIANMSLILQAYIKNISLTPAYQYDDKTLNTLLSPIIKKQYVAPINAVFSFTNGRVTSFQLSKDGQEVDTTLLKNRVRNAVNYIVTSNKPQQITLIIPIRKIKPQVASSDANKYGIKELLAEGTSLFAGSIPSRVYNVGLAASRINGALIKPGEEFSFDKTLGDVSSFTGYQQAYVIENHKTVLGDGGGVCQVSTTFFRALLNAGLPITEHHFHAYEVHYYTEDAPLGFDSTIYVPTVDLKFINDTGHYILVQTAFDAEAQTLTISLYGTSDGRVSTVSTPIVSNVVPAPDPLYVDDPTLPIGTVKQTDFAAPGADVSFTRTVTRNGKTLINETYYAHYQPWQAIYNRGTKS